MNKGLVAGTIIIAVVLLGLPLAGRLASNSNSSADGGTDAGQEGGAPAKLDPPLWTNENLAGTEWTYMMHTLKMMPGGVGVLSGPMYSGEGTWKIEGNKITISVPKMNKTVEGVISGDKFLDNKGKPLPMTRSK